MNNIIKNYVEKINYEDIIRFGGKNNITVDKDESLILLDYLKNNWEEFLYGDPLPIIRKLEGEIGKTKCEKISELLFYYKDKYINYL